MTPIQTNWCVITGTSCSGKSTLLQALCERGMKCVQEVARPYFESEMAKGRSMTEIRSDESVLQRELGRRRAENEEQLLPFERAYLDRAMPDSVAYAHVRGFDAGDLLELAKRFRYHRVFLLARLPFANDRVRVESEAHSLELERQIRAEYLALGYEPIEIPVASVEERAELMLSLAD